MPLRVNKFSPPPPPHWPEAQPTPPITPGRAPGIYPLTIGRTVSLAFNLFRFGWRTFAAISLLAAVPLVIINALVTSATFQAMSDWQQSLMQELDVLAPSGASPTIDIMANFPWQAFALTFVVALLIGPITFICNAALISATSDVVSGARLSFSASYRAAFGRIGGLIGLYILVTAIGVGLSLVLTIGPVVTIAIPGALGAGGPLAFIALVMGVAIVFLTVFFLIRLFFAIEVLILEQTSVSNALRRSYGLVAGSMLRVVGYAVVFGLLIGLIGVGVGVVAFFVAGLIAPQTFTSPTALIDMRVVIVQDVTSALLAAVFAPITTIGMVLLYFDLRWRHGEAVPVPGGGETEVRVAG